MSQRGDVLVRRQHLERVLLRLATAVVIVAGTWFIGWQLTSTIGP